MRKAYEKLDRFLGTGRVGKHRIFFWVQKGTLPDCEIIVFARNDDYFFGVLQSRIHTVWSLAKGTQLRERNTGFRYTPTTTFETFPLPRPTTEQQEPRIATAAKALETFRQGWLKPKAVAQRTLTQLYTDNPTWLRQAHGRLDAAVARAYGWPTDSQRRRHSAPPASSKHGAEAPGWRRCRWRRGRRRERRITGRLNYFAVFGVSHQQRVAGAPALGMRYHT